MALAKLVWQDVHHQEKIKEFVLEEGATATIGRSANNDIQIQEHHVSRQHAVINFREGVFMIQDLGSSNGTYVNDERIEDPYVLIAGDVIRLYVPELKFLPADEADRAQAEESGFFIPVTASDGQGSLIVTNGPQEGQVIPLLLDEVTIGRATSNATWEVVLHDPSVSRPHARLKRDGAEWFITDLKSSNGTTVNGAPVMGDQSRRLRDGDSLMLGGSYLIFRAGWDAPREPHPSETIPRNHLTDKL